MGIEPGTSGVDLEGEAIDLKKRRSSMITVITGGAGFIGVNLARRLSLTGRRIRVLDNLSSGSMDNLSGVAVELIRGDIRDPEVLADVLRDAKSVVHLAASGSVDDSVRDPVENFDVNVRGTINLLEACKKGDIKKVIFASTGGALAGDVNGPVHEDVVPRPISPYGASKLCGEAYCGAYARSYGIKTIALRFANVYGPYSLHKKGVVTSFIKAIIARQPLKIFGDGSATRDFIHVEDLCEGISAAIDSSLEGAEIIHLATGVETSMLELARIVCKVAGEQNYPIELHPIRRGEVYRNVGSYRRAHELLAFSPQVQLEEGIRQSWE